MHCIRAGRRKQMHAKSNPYFDASSRECRVNIAAPTMAEAAATSEVTALLCSVNEESTESAEVGELLCVAEPAPGVHVGIRRGIGDELVSDG